MSTSDIFIRLITFLAAVRSLFRQTHLFAEKESVFREISTNVEPFRTEEGDYADQGVTLSIALNANLRDPPGPEKRALGMSLLVRRSAGIWIAEAEIGWTGDQVGWDPFLMREIQHQDPEQLIANAPTLVEWMDSEFRRFVSTLHKQTARICPVCGWGQLEKPAYDRYGCASFEICPCCGTEFGSDDSATSHDVLRQTWISSGARWWSSSRLPPVDWSASNQLENAGFLHQIEVHLPNDELDAVWPLSVADDTLAECRELLARGAGIENLLRALRERGATKMESIKALVDLNAVSLREAKTYVHLSRTWSDVRERDDRLHSSLDSAMSTDPAPEKDHR